jgi:hypothetical protein
MRARWVSQTLTGNLQIDINIDPNLFVSQRHYNLQYEKRSRGHDERHRSQIPRALSIADKAAGSHR